MTNLIAQAKGLPTAVKTNQYTGVQALMLGIAIVIVIATVLIVFGNKAILIS